MTKLHETDRSSNPAVIVTIEDVESVPKAGFFNLRNPLVEDNENIDRTLGVPVLGSRLTVEE